ncbi:MAG: hypothetical protein IT252_11970 [Chitinophagaceae bacterium]|nr:hypothetical protein [Chitinophagaceae bacterium]
MKKLLMGVLGFFPTVLFGQITLVPKYTHPDSSILFVGVNNEFSIDGLNDTKGVLVTSTLKSKCDILEQKLIVRPNTTGIDTLKVYKNKKLLTIKVYNTEFLSDPAPLLANTFDKTLTVGRLVAIPYVSVRIPKTINIGPFHISMFELTLIQNKKGQQKTVYSTDGNKLSEQMISGIRKLEPGDEILVSKLICVGPDGTSRMMPKFKVTIQ